MRVHVSPRVVRAKHAESVARHVFMRLIHRDDGVERRGVTRRDRHVDLRQIVWQPVFFSVSTSRAVGRFEKPASGAAQTRCLSSNGPSLDSHRAA